MEELEAEEEDVESNKHDAQILVKEEDCLQMMEEVSLNEKVEIYRKLMNILVSGTH